MKGILENEEVFEAYARIDYCYYELEAISKSMDDEGSLLPIERMIDNATGHGEKMNEERKQQIIDLLEEVISSKKIINADYTNDEKALLNIINSK